MLIWIEHYPTKMKFMVRGKLPPFKYGCPTRTALLIKQLQKEKVDTWQSYDCFIVEKIIRHHGGKDETWLVGS